MAVDKRWDDAIHFKPDSFETFWADRLEGAKDILLIIGLGWDPRMTVLSRALKAFGGRGLRHLHLIRYRPSSSYVSPYKEFIDKNIEELDKVIENWAEKKVIDIVTREPNNLYIGDEEISKYYTKFDLTPYTDILVDISSLTKSLYFTLLLILVKKSSNSLCDINVHIVCCQDVVLDSQIIESADDTRLLKGFKAKLTRLSQQRIPKIWVPVLAKNNSVSLRKLYEFINPQDVYPVLPFPSRNPRNDDDLLVEYRQIFASEWDLNPMNIIYAAEDDPLDVYRSILNLFYQQKEALKPLGRISMAVSALSSKLSSIGAFMSAFEGNMALAHAIGRHNPPETLNLDFWGNSYMTRFKDNLHSIWLTGEPYVA